MVTLGVALALTSAFATNVGFLLRHRGALAAPDVDVRYPWRSAVALFRSRWWTIGYLVAALAYALHVGALALASLSVVQAVLAGGLVLLGVIAERWFGFHLGRKEWVGIALVTVGLAFLALTGSGESGQQSAEYSFAAMLAFESALVGLGSLLILAHRANGLPSRHGVLLGAAAGLLFTVTHVAVKALIGEADENAVAVLVYALVAVSGAVAAFFASARSLQIGDGVTVIALTSIASNASAIPAGIIVFGDPIGDDAMSVILRSMAFLLVVLAAALIPAPTRAAGSPGRAPTQSEQLAPARAS